MTQDYLLLTFVSTKRDCKLTFISCHLQKNPTIDINVEDEYLRQYPLKVAVQLQKEVSIQW